MLETHNFKFKNTGFFFCLTVVFLINDFNTSVSAISLLVGGSNPKNFELIQL